VAFAATLGLSPRSWPALHLADVSELFELSVRRQHSDKRLSVAERPPMPPAVRRATIVVVVVVVVVVAL
jgi:hypothetical protein